MHYYALLKQTNFNPEEQLRLRLFWEKWENKLKSKHINSSCLCYYGMNKEYIRKTVIDVESRINQDILNSHIGREIWQEVFHS